MLATEVFARHAARFRNEQLHEEVLHSAKRAVIDWYASLYAGLDEPAVQALEGVLADDLDRGAAHLARGRPATARAAALIHGTAAHAGRWTTASAMRCFTLAPRPSPLRSPPRKSQGPMGWTSSARSCCV
jgi:hypothetical protein